MNGSEKAVTNDSEKNIVNGQSVHRNEFGINKGTFLVTERKFACILPYGSNYGY